MIAAHALQSPFACSERTERTATRTWFPFCATQQFRYVRIFIDDLCPGHVTDVRLLGTARAGFLRFCEFPHVHWGEREKLDVCVCVDWSYLAVILLEFHVRKFFLLISWCAFFFYECCGSVVIVQVSTACRFCMPDCIPTHSLPLLFPFLSSHPISMNVRHSPQCCTLFSKLKQVLEVNGFSQNILYITELCFHKESGGGCKSHFKCYSE